MKQGRELHFYRSQLFFFLFFFLFLLFRQWNRFFTPVFDGDDLTHFIPAPFLLGWKSIFLPYAGYFQIAPAFLTWVSSKISTNYLPQLVHIESTAVYAYMISLLSRESFKWLVSSSFLRFLAGIVITFMPGNIQVVGSYCNLHSVLLLWSVLWLLQSPKQETKWYEWIIFAVACFSAGESVVLFPLIFMRFYFFSRFISKQKCFEEMFKTIIILASTTACFFIFETTKNLTSLHSETLYDIWDHFFPNRFFYALINRLYLLPLFGEQITLFFNEHWQLVLWSGGLFTCLWVFLFKCTWKKEYLLILGSILSYICLIFMVLLARQGTWNTAWFGLLTDSSNFPYRYMFILTPVAVLTWISLLSNVLNIAQITKLYPRREERRVHYAIGGTQATQQRRVKLSDLCYTYAKKVSYVILIYILWIVLVQRQLLFFNEDTDSWEPAAKTIEQLKRDPSALLFHKYTP